MNKISNILLSFILVLVVLNLLLTVSVLNKQTLQSGVIATMVASGVASKVDRNLENMDSEIAQDWGGKVTRMYNQQSHEALYALFNEQAKVKISHHQLQTELNNLYQLFGEIEERAFVSAKKIGEKGDELYYKLLFNIRVNQANKRRATLTISVVKKYNKISLYGVRLNASHSLD
jgi:regulatory protein YycI of two-component signal transduction system YycFG